MWQYGIYNEERTLLDEAIFDDEFTLKDIAEIAKKGGVRKDALLLSSLPLLNEDATNNGEYDLLLKKIALLNEVGLSDEEDLNDVTHIFYSNSHAGKILKESNTEIKNLAEKIIKEKIKTNNHLHFKMDILRQKLRGKLGKTDKYSTKEAKTHIDTAKQVMPMKHPKRGGIGE